MKALLSLPAWHPHPPGRSPAAAVWWSRPWEPWQWATRGSSEASYLPKPGRKAVIFLLQDFPFPVPSPEVISFLRILNSTIASASCPGGREAAGGEAGALGSVECGSLSVLRRSHSFGHLNCFTTPSWALQTRGDLACSASSPTVPVVGQHSWEVTTLKSHRRPQRDLQGWLSPLLSARVDSSELDTWISARFLSHKH